jgi:hypothetical protein
MPVDGQLATGPHRISPERALGGVLRPTCFVLGVLAWLGWKEGLRRLAVHGAAAAKPAAVSPMRAGPAPGETRGGVGRWRGGVKLE